MRRHFLPPFATRLIVAGALLGALAAPVRAQLMAPDYTLTAPSWLVAPAWPAEADGADGAAALPIGPLRVGGSVVGAGSGLSLEAGEKWFARAGLGRSLEEGQMSVGGGFRFAGGQALSMHVTRQLGQERLGLAVRYDLQRSYLRLAYEQPLRVPGASDRLRFSAGVRF